MIISKVPYICNNVSIYIKNVGVASLLVNSISRLSERSLNSDVDWQLVNLDSKE